MLSPTLHVLCIEWHPAFPKTAKRAALLHRRDAPACAAGCRRCLCETCTAPSTVAAGRAFLPKTQWETLFKSKRLALPHRASFCCPGPCVEARPVLPHQMHQPGTGTFSEALVCEELSPYRGHAERPHCALDPARTSHNLFSSIWLIKFPYPPSLLRICILSPLIYSSVGV